MSVTVGSNIASLRAQRQLARSSDALSSTFEKLSSGQRINRASDDAAGLAIADSLNAISRIQSVAIRNVNDGISASNILSGALTSQNEVLTRIAELAEQSANGTFDNNQRKAINTEYRALVAEMARIGRTTNLNGVNLMDSTSSKYLSTLILQAGVDSSADSQLKLQGIHSAANGGVISFRDALNMSDAITNNFGQVGLTLAQIQSAFGTAIQEVKVHDTNGNERTILAITGSYGSGVSFLTLGRSLADESKSVADSVWGTEVDATYFDFATATNRSYNAQTGMISNGQLDLSQGDLGFTIAASERYFDVGGLSYSSSAPASNLEFNSLVSQASARKTLDAVRNRIDDVSRKLGQVGAFQSRAHTAIANLEVGRENNKAAEERVRGIDVASESANLVQSQILQQAAVAVLGQANQLPALVLRLLS